MSTLLSVKRLVLTWGAIKGSVLAAVMAAVDISFVKALIIASVSGFLGSIGVVLGAIISARESRKNRAVLHDVKRKLGAAQRASDEAEDLTL